ncbi:MAG: PEP-CTERM sorting domain-containing protein [Armatimonadota bacterium]|nr:PEP-CTERM sorting domain-containing protein [Armatimonadota bacterium]
MLTARRAKLCSAVAAAAVILLFGFHIPGFAQQYSVVANYSNGTVSLLKYAGGGWTTVGNPYSVGGRPRGVTTFGQNVYVVNDSGYVSILKAVDTGTSAVLMEVQQHINLPNGVGSAKWGAVGSGDDWLYVTGRRTGTMWELRKNNNAWMYYGSEALTWDDSESVPPNHTASRNPEGVLVVRSMKGGSDKVFVANEGINYRNVTGVSGVTVFGDGGRMNVSVEGGPTDLALSETDLGRYVFTDFRSGVGAYRLAAIDPETGIADLTSYDIGSVEPDSLAAVADHLFIAEKGTNKIHRYTLSKATGLTHTDIVELTGSSAFHRLSVSPDGTQLLVTSAEQNSLSWINISGDQFSYVNRLTGFGYPEGVAFVRPGPVPEPSTLSGVAIGILTALGAARRRLRKGERQER